MKKKRRRKEPIIEGNRRQDLILFMHLIILIEYKI